MTLYTGHCSPPTAAGVNKAFFRKPFHLIMYDSQQCTLLKKEHLIITVYHKPVLAPDPHNTGPLWPLQQVMGSVE